MSDSCCEKKGCELEKLQEQQSKVLWAVLGINAVMFVVELTAGIWADSVSLTGDSLDMLGDAIVYGSSLYALTQGSKAQARSALLKGCIMFLSAVAVFARASYQVLNPVTPEISLMSLFSILVLVANLVCLWLLTRHKDDNLNMSAVWLCSRNDIIANTSVLLAAGLVALTDSFIPDLVVGLFITFVFAKSAGKVLLRSWHALQEA